MPATCPVDVEYSLLPDQFLISRTDADSKISLEDAQGRRDLGRHHETPAQSELTPNSWTV